MQHLAKAGPDVRFSARELAKKSYLPYPTVSKILKHLHAAQLLFSERGVSGGYLLARPAREISVADIIVALDGPVAITLCSNEAGHECKIAADCPVKNPLQMVNTVVLNALKNVRLTDMLLMHSKKDVQPVLNERSL